MESNHTKQIKELPSISVMKTENDNLITKPLIIIHNGIPQMHHNIMMFGCHVETGGEIKFRNFFIIRSIQENRYFAAVYPGQELKNPPAVILTAYLNLNITR